MIGMTRESTAISMKRLRERQIVRYPRATQLEGAVRKVTVVSGFDPRAGQGHAGGPQSRTVGCVVGPCVGNAGYAK